MGNEEVHAAYCSWVAPLAYSVDPQLVQAEVDGAVGDMLPQAEALAPADLPPLAPWVPKMEAGFLERAGWAQEEAAEADYLKHLWWDLQRVAAEELRERGMWRCRL